MAYTPDSIWNQPVFEQLTYYHPTFHRNVLPSAAAAAASPSPRRNSSNPAAAAVAPLQRGGSFTVTNTATNNKGPPLSTSAGQNGATATSTTAANAGGSNKPRPEWVERYRLPKPPAVFAKAVGDGKENNRSALNTSTTSSNDGGSSVAADRTPTDLFAMMRAEVTATSSINEILRRMRANSVAAPPTPAVTAGRPPAAPLSSAATLTNSASASPPPAGVNGGGGEGSSSNGRLLGSGLASRTESGNANPLESGSSCLLQSPSLPQGAGGAATRVSSFNYPPPTGTASAKTPSTTGGVGSSNDGSRSSSAHPAAATTGTSTPIVQNGGSATGSSNVPISSSIASMMASQQLERARKAVYPYAAKGGQKLSNAEILQGYREQQQLAADMSRWMESCTENDPAYCYEMSKVGGTDYWRPGDPPPYDTHLSEKERAGITITSLAPSFDALFSATAEQKFHAQMEKEAEQYPDYERMREWITKRMVPLEEHHMLTTDVIEMNNLMKRQWSRYCLAPPPVPARPLYDMPNTYPESRITHLPVPPGDDRNLFSTFVNHKSFVGGDVTNLDADNRRSNTTGEMLDEYKVNDAVMPWLKDQKLAPFDPLVSTNRNYLPEEVEEALFMRPDELWEDKLKGYQLADRLAHSRRMKKEAKKQPEPRWLDWDDDNL